jgi:hypothetical protein
MEEMVIYHRVVARMERKIAVETVRMIANVGLFVDLSY